MSLAEHCCSHFHILTQSVHWLQCLWTRIVQRPWDGLYFLKGMTKTFPPDLSTLPSYISTNLTTFLSSSLPTYFST